MPNTEQYMFMSFANKFDNYNNNEDNSDVPNKHILEIGCGYGAFCCYAANNGAASVTGIDYSKDAIKYAQKFSRITINECTKKSRKF